MPSLEEQLAEVFGRGLDSDPNLRASLAEALLPSEGKYTKAEAKYRSEGSDNEQCADCAHFQSPDRCLLVSGSISPSAICDYFDMKEEDDNGGDDGDDAGADGK